MTLPQSRERSKAYTSMPRDIAENLAEAERRIKAQEEKAAIERQREKFAKLQAARAERSRNAARPRDRDNGMR